jgi:hypothetical protein
MSRMPRCLPRRVQLATIVEPHCPSLDKCLVYRELWPVTSIELPVITECLHDIRKVLSSSLFQRKYMLREQWQRATETTDAAG